MLDVLKNLPKKQQSAANLSATQWLYSRAAFRNSS